MITILIALALQAQTRLEYTAEKAVVALVDPSDPASLKKVEDLKRDGRHDEIWIQFGTSHRVTRFMRVKDIQSLESTGMVLMKVVDENRKKVKISQDWIDCSANTTILQSLTLYKEDGTVEASVKSQFHPDPAPALAGSMDEYEIHAACKAR